MTVAISCLFRVLFIICFYEKTLNKNTQLKVNMYIYWISISLFYVFNLYINNCTSIFKSFLSIGIFYLLSHFIYNIKHELSYIAILLSHVIFYVINYICSITLLVLFSPFYYFDIQLPYVLLSILTGIITLGMFFLLLKIKFFSQFLKSILSIRFLPLVVFICVIILTLKTFDTYCIYNNEYKYNSALPIDALLPLATFFLILLLFTWWRKQITKSYIEKLRKLEVQSLYDELEEKERQIQKLVADNESLSRIIHKDNKLIPAMENAVISFLSTENYNDSDKLKLYGLELTQKLQDMSRDRQGILDSYDNDNHKLKLTGHVSLDAILVYMKKKADTNHICLECKHTPDTIDYLLTKISEDDLTHLLSDLMENAIISMKEHGNGRLQITFGKLQKEAYISIADSGIHFDIATLHSFGLQPHTTHEDSGGSGIGLMDIWKIKRKYRATIQIQEYEKNTTNFTKRILFSFNSKNHYVIQSFRHAEISNTQTRGDLYVIPAETKEKNEGEKHERNIENLNS